MLLFFFMVTTVMRETDLLVKTTLPEATQVTKLEDKALVDYIYIGPPLTRCSVPSRSMQLNYQFASWWRLDWWVKVNEERREKCCAPMLPAP